MEVPVSLNEPSGWKQVAPDESLVAEKENLHCRQSSNRASKRVLVDHPITDDCVQLKKARQYPNSERHFQPPISKSFPLTGITTNKSVGNSKSWSQCNFGPKKVFGSSRYGVLAEETSVTERVCLEKPTPIFAVTLSGDPLANKPTGKSKPCFCPGNAMHHGPVPKESEHASRKLHQLVSPLSGPLGFTIRVQRHGKESEAELSKDAEAVCAGFFASSAPSSLVRIGSRADCSVVLKEVSSPPEQLPVPEMTSREDVPHRVARISKPSDTEIPTLHRTPPNSGNVEDSLFLRGQKQKVVKVKSPIDSKPSANISLAQDMGASVAVLQNEVKAQASVLRRSSRNKTDPAVVTYNSQPLHTQGEDEDSDYGREKSAQSRRKRKVGKAKECEANVATPAEERPPGVSQMHGRKDIPLSASETHEQGLGKEGTETAKAPEAWEESSWSHPKALKRKPSARNQASSTTHKAYGIGNVQVGSIFLLPAYRYNSNCGGLHNL